MESKQSQQSKGKEKAYRSLKDVTTQQIQYIYSDDVTSSSFLGKGQFGTVFKGYAFDEKTKKRGAPVAIKKISLTGLEDNQSKLKALLKSTQAEIGVFKQLNFKINAHPNLIIIKDVYQTERNMYIVMELCEKNENLHYYIQKRYKSGNPISENEAILILDNVLQGLAWLNKHNIMHRDIKADNVIRLNKNGDWKLCDYGFSRITEKMGEASKRNFTRAGTPFYMSPQILKGKPYGYKTDVYSVGVLFYEILFGEMPYENCQNMKQLVKATFKSDLGFNRQKRKISHQLQSFIKQLLSIEEENRFSIKEIFNMKDYKYIQNKNKLNDSVLYQDIKKEIKTEGELFQNQLQPRISQIVYGNFLMEDQETQHISKTLFLEILHCNQGSYAGHDFFCLFQEYDNIKQYKWLLVFCLIKAVFTKGKILYELTYKKKQNTHQFKKEAWQHYLKTESFENQKSMLHMIMMQLNSFYEGIYAYHQKKFNELYGQFQDPIMQKFNQTKEITHPYKQYVHLNKIIIPNIVGQLKQKSLLCKISIQSLVDYFLFKIKFKFLDVSYGISFIKKYYKNLEDVGETALQSLTQEIQQVATMK